MSKPSHLLLLAAVVFTLLAIPTALFAQPIVEPLDPNGGTAPIEIAVANSEFPGESDPTLLPAFFSTSAPTESPDLATDDPAWVAPELWEATWNVYLPGVRFEPSAASLNMGNRASVLAFYNANYRVATPSIGWTGSYGSCNAGTTSAAYLEATRRRVAFYRALAGVPSEIVMHQPFVQQAQAAALMMSVNGKLSHSPSSSWTCYSSDGAKAAGAANLASAPGITAIDLYMHDSDGGNAAVGHRRWLLYPQLQRIGAGSTPNNGVAFGANALYVLDSETLFGARPAVRDGYVAWPPRGFLPYTITPTRWSFSYPNAGFGGATVSMWQNGAALGVRKEAVTNGFGENTVAWVPNIGASPWPRPSGDATYKVQIDNVRIGGAARSFSYTVVIFDPG